MKPKRQDDFLIEFNQLATRVATLERLVQSPQLITDGRLPENPYDGQQVSMLVDSNLGVKWAFEFREDSPNDEKWEFVSGPPLYSAVDADDSTDSTVFIDLGGPSLVAPLAGQYEIHAGTETYEVSSANWHVLGLNINAGTTEEWAVAHGGANDYTPINRRAVREVPLANSVVKTQIRTTGGTGTNFRRTWLFIKPIRVK